MSESRASCPVEIYFKQHPREPSLESDATSFLTWHILAAEFKESSDSIVYLSRCLTDWATKDISPKITWQNTQMSLSEYDISLDDVILKYVIYSIESHKPETLSRALFSAANSTKIPSLIFQSAFTSFNLERPAECIQTLKLLDAQTCQTSVLMAQAYQDLKDFTAAQECLLQATEHTPNDGMAWFQLARNSFAMKKLKDAWDAINVCSDLFNSDAEVDLLRLMIGLELKDHNNDESQKLFVSSVDRLMNNSFAESNEQLFVKLSSLAVKYGNQDWYLHLCDVSDFSNYTITHGLLGHVGKTMRQLHMLGWHDASIKFNDKLQSALSEKTASTS